MNMSKDWKEFKLCELFPKIERGTRLTKFDREDGTVPLVTAGYQNEGVAGFISNDSQEIYGKTITIDMFCNVFYRDYDFCCDDNILVISDYKYGQNIGLFLATIISKDKFRFAYGRQYRKKDYLKHVIKLPIDELGGPDWKYMNDYIQELQERERESEDSLANSLVTNNTKPLASILINSWKEFTLDELFSIQYGVNMELNSMTETSKNDPTGIAFVARTSENNGVVSYVKKVEGKEPQPAETITVAGGGSVLSTFVQNRPFYSGRDLYLLIPKNQMDLYTKLFICTLIKQNKYKYSYGRQANKTLKNLLIKLPTDHNGKPNYTFMKSYMMSLPYADRIIQ